MHLKQGNLFFSQGKYQEAMAEYQKVAPNSPLYALAQFNLSRCHTYLPAQTEALTDGVLSVKEMDLATQIMQHRAKKARNATLAPLYKKWRALTSKKSIDAEVRDIRGIRSQWNEDIILPPLPLGQNDFHWYATTEHHKKRHINHENIGLSVIIPTYNRTHILSITLACLVNQETTYPFEVWVVDDGSKEDIQKVVKQFEDKLNVKYIYQPDRGYKLCQVRNFGLKISTYPFVAILDCDMAPAPQWVESYVDALKNNNNIAYIGPRKYIDTRIITVEKILADKNFISSIPEITQTKNISSKMVGNIVKDWRLEQFEQTNNLQTASVPQQFFSGGNIAFDKKWLTKAGFFDEDFQNWGGEDNEFAHRLFRQGCFFQALMPAMAYHQEPPGAENETDREAGKKITINQLYDRTPFPYRKLTDIRTARLHKRPLVSIYIPAYNCEKFIQQAVDSALNQTVWDLEVVVCDDGSTDNTWQVLQHHYGNHPRVTLLQKENGGIASSSNMAVRHCRGYYIGQLDGDDYLEPDAVELCIKAFFANKHLALVYTTNRNVDINGKEISKGYNWPIFSREKMLTASIVHHFRMFTIRAYHLTDGFNEELENAVDYDFYLKLTEVGEVSHINKICYNRRLHGENTSIKKLDKQKNNHFISVNNALRRMGINDYQVNPTDNDPASRKLEIVRKS